MEENTTQKEEAPKILKAAKEIKDTIELNGKNTTKEPSIQIEPVTNKDPKEPPMTMFGSPNISDPVLRSKTLEVEYENPETYKITLEKVEIYRLNVQEREEIAMYFCRLFQTLGVTDVKEGLTTARLLSLDEDALLYLTKYIRLIAPVATRTSEVFWKQVSWQECLKIFNEIFDFEIGLVKAIEDLFSMVKLTTEDQKSV